MALGAMAGGEPARPVPPRAPSGRSRRKRLRAALLLASDTGLRPRSAVHGAAAECRPERPLPARRRPVLAARSVAAARRSEKKNPEP